MPDHAAMIAAVETYCKVQTGKDREGWAALFDMAVRHEDPVGFGRVAGYDHVVGAFWDHIERNDVRIWLTDDVVVCGNEALAIMACDIGPATNRTRIAPVVDHFVFSEAGLIVSVRGFYNMPVTSAK